MTDTANKNQVLVFTTGGTIEKTYSEADGSIKNNESILKEKLVQKLRLPNTNIEIEEIMAKDSLDMSPEDREEIFKFIEGRWNTGKPIVVLHGTDTLEVTLRHCFERNSRPPVPIIFTGAMKPPGFDDSDAPQNFTEALFASQIVPPGFYLAFHGQLFDAPNLTKDRETGTFVETY